MNLAIKLNPNYAAVFEDRGVASYNKQEYDVTFVDDDQATKIDSSYTIVLADVSGVFENKREDNRVTQEIVQALKVNTTQATAAYNRGNL